MTKTSSTQPQSEIPTITEDNDIQLSESDLKPLKAIYKEANE
eukprot:COSAG02_NODE_51001_length_317_cov_0.678899_1_plen_41_part_10